MWFCWPKKTNQKSLGARPARPKRWGHPTEPHFPSNCTSDQRSVSCNNYTDPKSSLANSSEEENKRTKNTWFGKSKMFAARRLAVFYPPPPVFILHDVPRRRLNITRWLVCSASCAELVCWWALVAVQKSCLTSSRYLFLINGRPVNRRRKKKKKHSQQWNSLQTREWNLKQFSWNGGNTETHALAPFL